MPDDSNPTRDDAVRLVTAVLAEGPESDLAVDIATDAIETHPPVEFAVDVADIAATSLQHLAEAEGASKEQLLQEITDRRTGADLGRPLSSR
ncbi:hypothetical protein [Naasia aerilata]|uniref:ANTAR domain-containing protein n=1 Tax=Naasia aerilata TaxID=1162966 RepID=A0ABM8GDU9_9MICO|nr:hypothetical protein [Naasia aerilata]BDZ46470.1 hypothetical protein GCM10025866_23790 [Naasia aerilata]